MCSRFKMYFSLVVFLSIFAFADASCYTVEMGDSIIPSVNQTVFEVNESVPVLCANTSASLVGNNVMFCLGNRTWSEAPICISCNYSFHGIVTANCSDHGDCIVNFSCGPDEGLDGPDNLTCIDSKWSTNLPSCDKTLCGALIAPEHGHFAPENPLRPGDVTIFQCNAGFVIDGAEELTCLSSRNWSHSVPRCVESFSLCSGNVTANCSKSVATKTKKSLDASWPYIFKNGDIWSGFTKCRQWVTKFSATVSRTSFTQGGSAVLNSSQSSRIILYGNSETAKRRNSKIVPLTGSYVYESVNTTTVKVVLEKNNCMWMLNGLFKNSKGIECRLLIQSKSRRGCGSNNLAILTGLSIACLVLLMILGIMHFARKKVLQEPRSATNLSSFENPVYDLENGVKLTSRNNSI